MTETTTATQPHTPGVVKFYDELIETIRNSHTYYQGNWSWNDTDLEDISEWVSLFDEGEIAEADKDDNKVNLDQFTTYRKEFVCGAPACIAGHGLQVLTGGTTIPVNDSGTALIPKKLAKSPNAYGRGVNDPMQPVEWNDDIGVAQMGLDDAQAESLFAEHPTANWPGQWANAWGIAEKKDEKCVAIAILIAIRDEGWPALHRMSSAEVTERVGKEIARKA